MRRVGRDDGLHRQCVHVSVHIRGPTPDPGLTGGPPPDIAVLVLRTQHPHSRPRVFRVYFAHAGERLAPQVYLSDLDGVFPSRVDAIVDDTEREGEGEARVG